MCEIEQLASASPGPELGLLELLELLEKRSLATASSIVLDVVMLSQAAAKPRALQALEWSLLSEILSESLDSTSMSESHSSAPRVNEQMLH